MDVLDHRSSVRVAPSDGHDGAVCRLVFTGEMDSASDALLRGRLEECFAEVEAASPAVVEIDLGGVRFLGSYGVRLLLGIQRWAGERRLPLRIGGRVPVNVRRVLEITQVAHHLGGLPAADGESPA